MLVCCLGDLLLDVIVRLDEPLVWGADATARTRTGAGGQATNVAAWAAALGARARLVAKRGDDAAGALVAGELDGLGVEVVGPIEGGRTGVVVSVVGPDGERTMASDRGVSPELSAGDLDPAWFADCDVLHVTGYALLGEPMRSAALRAAELVPRVTLDLSSAAHIRSANGFRSAVEALRPSLVFANEGEREAAGELPVEWVVKRGPAGFEWRDETWPAQAAEVVDTTGAGDAFAAGFLLGGPELALEAAARCVARLGTMP
jgi:sugar/nucleoside kinase (ribokinase family)